MNTDQVNHELDEIERALQADDPALIARCRGLLRREAAHALFVFALLAAGAVLLVVGFATLSPLAWCAGGVAFVSAMLVDQLFERARRDLRAD